MWVLSTARAELHSFIDSTGVPGGYAILSHTWTPVKDGGEQTFQDVQRIVQDCKEHNLNPRDYVGEKIRRCCEIAEGNGYNWVWIDSCCINKESSTELSEAINSMFNWYAFAEVCYVFLEDVHPNDDPHAEKSEFQGSRWHTRGWTLQELLAPAFVIFLSRTWTPIGTKYDLRAPLSRRTGISIEYLTREQDFRVDASIARRMAWAADRQTTRVEDEAYCLLGLFDVNMPTLYGEGRQAFQRLQAELVKHNVDTTLFSWGRCHHPYHQGEPVSLSRMHARSHNPDNPAIFLFASSPHDFRKRWHVVCSPRAPALKHPCSTSRSRPTRTVRAVCIVCHSFSHNIQKSRGGSLGQAHKERPSFEVTPYGMKCRFPVAKVDGITIAILFCQNSRTGSEENLGLLLHPAPDYEVLDLSRELYYVSWAFRQQDGSGHEARRLASLGTDSNLMHYRGKTITATWRDIYIVAHPSTRGRTDGAHLLQRFIPDIAPTPYHIPRALMQTLSALKFLPVTKKASNSAPSKSNTLLLVQWQNTVLREAIRVLLGTCDETSADADPLHWAWAEPVDSARWNESPTRYVHDCATDHINDWIDRQRDFGDEERTIRLVFAPCPYSPAKTLVFGLELVGNVYEKMQGSANIRLPPPTRLQASSTPSSSAHPSLPYPSVGPTDDLTQVPPQLSEAHLKPRGAAIQKQIRQVSDLSGPASAADVLGLKESVDRLNVLLAQFLHSTSRDSDGPTGSDADLSAPRRYNALDTGEDSPSTSQ